MSEEDVTQGTRYFNVLKDVAEAARKVEAARGFNARRRDGGRIFTYQPAR